jgi:hypothetical protein
VRAAAGILLLLAAAPAMAAPPPPPSPAVLDVAKGFTSSMTQRDYARYADLLADGVTVVSNGAQIAKGKDAWLAEIRKAFSNPAFRPQILDVFEGYADGGEQLTVVERIGFFVYGNARSPDCCAYYRVETLRLANGKIVRIDQGPSLSGRLSANGERID